MDARDDDVGLHRVGPLAPASAFDPDRAATGGLSGNDVAVVGVADDGAAIGGDADPAHGEFANDRRLSDLEKQTIPLKPIRSEPKNRL